MARSVTPPDDKALDLTALKRRFSESRDLTAEARRECDIDDDYVNSYQWTPEERRQLAMRRQPDSVYNYVRPAVYGMLGVLKQGRTDPRAFGRNPEDDQAADVATKVLRFDAEKNDFVNIRLDVAYDYLAKGVGAVIIEGDHSGQITLQQVRWEEFFYDPRSRRKDFQDARYKGVAKWVYADVIKRMWGDKAGDVDQAIDAAVGVSPLDPTFADRPATQMGSWYDRKLRRVMLVEMYYNDTGDWRRAVFYSDKMLEEGPSPYKDQFGKPACPIEAESCFVDRDNNRYGVVRDMRSPQDEINKRQSKLLHILNNRQVFAENELAMNTSAAEVRDEAARPDGVLPIGWKPVSMSDIAGGQTELLKNAIEFIQRQAPNPAILGRLGNEESGRAQLVRQQSGMTELAIVLGGIERWELRVYRQIWERNKQFRTAPEYIRITDDMGAAQYIGINQPVHGPAQVGIHPQTGMPAITRPIMGYKNKLAELDVDIILDIQPHNPNLEAEQFQALVDLRRDGVPIDPMLIIQASSLPDKTKIIQAMQQQAQQPNPQQQLQVAGMQAEVQLKQADATHRNAQANLLGVEAQHKAAQTQLTQVQTQNEAAAPHNAMFQAGLEAGMSQAQFEADHALQKQELVAKQLQQLGDWQQQNAALQAQKAANQ